MRGGGRQWLGEINDWSTHYTTDAKCAIENGNAGHSRAQEPRKPPDGADFDYTSAD